MQVQEDGDKNTITKKEMTERISSMANDATKKNKKKGPVTKVHVPWKSLTENKEPFSLFSSSFLAKIEKASATPPPHPHISPSPSVTTSPSAASSPVIKVQHPHSVATPSTPLTPSTPSTASGGTTLGAPQVLIYIL